VPQRQAVYYCTHFAEDFKAEIGQLERFLGGGMQCGRLGRMDNEVLALADDGYRCRKCGLRVTYVLRLPFGRRSPRTVAKEPPRTAGHVERLTCPFDRSDPNSRPLAPIV
jgi:DNA-directed RNA polymerase subunit RPC12/RpoP